MLLLAVALSVLAAQPTWALQNPLASRAVQADTLFYNANIYALDKRNKHYASGALAVKDGIITWVGQSKDASKVVRNASAIQ
jgi:hypothetical protein